jgi:large subunit ribosomal protein L5
MDSCFKDLYHASLRKNLCQTLGLKNIQAVPKIEKIVINAGVKGVVQDSKLLNYVYDGITAIAGQKPVKTKAKKSIAGFKLREGVQVGCMVTLRGKVMYNFLEKLIKIVIPSIRDFRGLQPSFDASGNYNLGLRDWTVFQEIDFDRFPNPHGLNITMHIRCGNNKGASFALLKSFGMPFADVAKKV